MSETAGEKLDRELEVATQLALQAADLVKGFWGTDLAVDKKKGDEPVTIADRQASDLVVAGLRQAFPGDAVLSEEVPDDGSRLRNRRVWMVDPIDGTRDFIAGDTGFAVMIGLAIEGRARLGVLVMPAWSELFTGVVDPGGDHQAWKQVGGGAREPLRTTALAAPPGIRLVASKTHRTRDVDTFRQALAIQDEINVGSVGLKVAMVADARRDLYVYPGSRTKLWDTCGPEAVLVAAGGRLTDVHGHPLDYAHTDLQNTGGIIASNGPLHDLVIETLRPLMASRKLPG
jgi:3'(2'), 5'-bisphosphate nucleotidase